MNFYKLRFISLAVLLCCASLASRSIADTFGGGANSFNIDFVTIGNPGNAADMTGTPEVAGSVAYRYRIGKFEISRDMVTKANAAGTLGITLADMSLYGGNEPNKPAAGINWLEAATFVNWLNTSTGHSPAYKFDSAGFTIWQPGDAGFNPNNPFRNTMAHYFLPGSDEWYKAAYYDPIGQGYFDYPTGSDSAPTPILSGTAPGTAVYRSFDPGDEVYQQLVGPAGITQAGGLSPYGTMGQGGNLLEWEETDASFLNDSNYLGHGVRGGFWNTGEYDLKSTYRDIADLDFEWPPLGFRVASVVPEPATLFMAIIGLCALPIRRRHKSALQYRD